MHKLIIKKSARKELDNISNPFFLKIDEAILALKNNPHPYPQSKKLKGENKYRLRAGLPEVYENEQVICYAPIISFSPSTTCSISSGEAFPISFPILSVERVRI